MTALVSPLSVRAAWPEVVPNYRICRRCVMDTSDPEIQFRDDGVCNHCTRYDERVHAEVFQGDDGQRRLNDLVSRIRASGHRRDYDCLIGVSGGVDSTMVAYHVKRLGLRPLAIHLDNGWNSELAVANIQGILKKLDIDLHTHVIDWEEFRDLQLSFLRASVPNCEIPTDHAINALLINTALSHGIKYILQGGNVRTEGILPSAWGYDCQDLTHLRAIHARFGQHRLRTLPRISAAKYVYAVVARGIRYIPILNYLDYSKRAARELLQREFDWRDYGGKHYESIYTRFFQGYILPKKFGFDKRRAHLSALICAGEKTRGEALAELDHDPYDARQVAADREYVVKKLGLTMDEFDAIMASPPKLHEEYPQNAWIFRRLSGLRATFKRLATRA